MSNGSSFSAASQKCDVGRIIPPVQNTSYNASVYNPALFGQLAWDLGYGFGFSYALGSYFGIGEPVSWNSTSLNQRFALSYTGGGWNLTANVVYGIQLDSVTNRAQISPCPAPVVTTAATPISSMST